MYKKCKDCDITLPYEADYCSKCGKPLPNICPKCGATIQDNAKFCMYCGTSIYDFLLKEFTDLYSSKVMCEDIYRKCLYLAKHGNEEALRQFYNWLEKGYVFSTEMKDIENMVIQWLTPLMEKGDLQATVMLANRYFEVVSNFHDFDMAVQLYKKAAEQGDTHSMVSLGYIYDNTFGEYPCETDEAKAMEYYLKAAELGDDKGMYHAGLLFLFPEQGEPDVDKGMHWLVKAADDGNGAAAYKLGDLYSNSEIVPSILSEAEYYYTRATENGYDIAIVQLLLQSVKNKLAERDTVIRDACKDVADKVIKELENMPAEMSGDDSCLKNVWEEFCAQVQGEESPFFETYRDTIDSFILDEVQELDHSVKVAIWQSTDAFCDLSDREKLEQTEFCEEGIITDYIFSNAIYGKAADYSSDNIDKYLYNIDEDKEVPDDFYHICEAITNISDYYVANSTSPKKELEAKFFDKVKNFLDLFCEGDETDEVYIFGFHLRNEDELSYFDFWLSSDEVNVTKGGSVYDPAVGSDSFSSDIYHIDSGRNDSVEDLDGFLDLEYNCKELIDLGAHLTIGEAPDEFSDLNVDEDDGRNEDSD